MKAKKYGNERTNLVLSELAQKVYNESDPFEILEHKTEDGEYFYEIKVDMTDGFTCHYTADEVNEYLESFADCEECNG